MDKAMVIKAMKNIEEKLARAEHLAVEMAQKSEIFRATLGDMQHQVNNARQISASVRILVEMDV